MSIVLPPAAESAVRLLAFDLDGTLVDSAPGIIDTVNTVLAEWSIAPVPAPTVAAMIGLQLEVFWERLTPVPAAAWPELTARYRAIYRETAIPAIVLFPDVRPLIEALDAAGYVLTIASSKITPVSRAVLEHVDLLEPFRLLMGNDSVSRPKPHAEMLERTLEICGVGADQALMVGDTTHDIDLGDNAGVRTVAVANGTHDYATLAAGRPAFLIKTLSELPGILAQMVQ
jgi:phosphoglycolate phosphatase